ncbi:MAG: hypothetical protein ACT4PL_04940, partial [Phycisphaerales bacterium]
MNRETAKRTTRNAQLAGAGLLLAAVGLTFIPADMWAASGGAPSRSPRARDDRPGSRVEPAQDATVLALALETISPDMPDEAPPAPPPPPPDPEVPAPPPPTPVQTWRYIGGVFSGALKKAIVVIDESQRFVSAGDVVNNATVVEVRPDYLTIDEAGVRRYIPIAQRIARTAVPIGIPVAIGPPPSITTITPALNEQLVNLEALRQKDRAAYLAEKRRISEQLQVGSNLPFMNVAKQERLAEVNEKDAINLMNAKAAAAGRTLSQEEENAIRKGAAGGGGLGVHEVDSVLLIDLGEPFLLGDVHEGEVAA